MVDNNSVLQYNNSNKTIQVARKIDKRHNVIDYIRSDMKRNRKETIANATLINNNDDNNDSSKQRTVTNDNRKNQKLLDVPIKNKKDNITESSLVSLEMTESYQQLETSTIKGKKFRSNANEGGFFRKMKNYN